MENIKEMAAALAAYEAENNNKAAIEENAQILEAFNDLKALMFAFARDFCVARSERPTVDAYNFAEVANEREAFPAAVALTVTEDDEDEDSNNPSQKIAKNQIIVAYNAFKQQLDAEHFPKPSATWPEFAAAAPVILSTIMHDHIPSPMSTSNWPGQYTAAVVYTDSNALIEALKRADASVIVMQLMTTSTSDSNSIHLNTSHNNNVSSPESRLDIIAAACQSSPTVVNEILAKNILNTSVRSAVVAVPELEGNMYTSNSSSNNIILTPPSVEIEFKMKSSTVVRTYTPAWTGATTVSAKQGDKSIEDIAEDMAEAYYQSKWLEHPEKSKDVFNEFIKTLPPEPVSSRNPRLQTLLLVALKAKGFESFYSAEPMQRFHSSHDSSSNGHLRRPNVFSTSSYSSPPTERHINGYSSSQPVTVALNGGNNKELMTLSTLVTLQNPVVPV